MLGVLKPGLEGRNLDGNRSVDSWQDETNADKFGRRDPIAVGYDRTGMERLTYDDPHNFGDTYYPTYFLGIDDEHYPIGAGKLPQHQISFDLTDLMQSTGKV